VLRKTLPNCVAIVTQKTKKVSNWIIIFIVHCAFAQSVHSGFLDGLSGGSMIAITGSTVTILAVVSQLVWWTGRWLKPSRAQHISMFFCASQKSLATGLPLTTSILAAAPESVNAAAILIPLMCYHPAQLVLAGFVSGKWSAKKILDDKT
jgi:sodium/bile acid cotransporter 7